MSKGEVTRERIIELTAPLFNQMGFAGASLSDIMRVTGLKKGGIYNHFESKEDLAVQAFDYAIAKVIDRHTRWMDARQTTVDKLIAFAEVFRENFVRPVIEGGCPLMNTAIDSDDTNPQLRERVRHAMSRCRVRITEIVEQGAANGQLRADLDAGMVASCLISILEGGTMLSRLYGDVVHLDRAIDHVISHIYRDLAAQPHLSPQESSQL